jgi:hypothetical protein
MHQIKLYSITLYSIVLFSLTSHSTTWDKAYLQAFAKEYLEEKLLPPVGGKISISIANIDPRIKFNLVHSFYSLSLGKFKYLAMLN